MLVFNNFGAIKNINKKQNTTFTRQVSLKSLKRFLRNKSHKSIHTGMYIPENQILTVFFKLFAR